MSLRETEKNNDKTVTEDAVVIELEMGKFLNRASHFTMLFAETVKFLNPKDAKQVDEADIEKRDYFPDSTGETLLDGTELMEQLLHFSAMCDLHAKYIDIDDPRFAAPAAPGCASGGEPQRPPAWRPWRRSHGAKPTAAPARRRQSAARRRQERAPPQQVLRPHRLRPRPCRPRPQAYRRHHSCPRAHQSLRRWMRRRAAARAIRASR